MKTSSSKCSYPTDTALHFSEYCLVLQPSRCPSFEQQQQQQQQQQPLSDNLPDIQLEFKIILLLFSCPFEVWYLLFIISFQMGRRPRQKVRLFGSVIFLLTADG